MQILWSKDVAEGRITPNEFVALTSTNHARKYGIYPRKGSIGVGFDADIVIWDPSRKETIRQELLHHGSDHTPYEGLAVTGWPVMTILRGKVVCQGARSWAHPATARFSSVSCRPMRRRAEALLLAADRASRTRPHVIQLFAPLPRLK